MEHPARAWILPESAGRRAPGRFDPPASALEQRAEPGVRRRLERELAPVRWVRQDEAQRVQAHPRRARAVARIADHGVPEVRQVRADLVPAAGLELDLEQAPRAAALAHAPAR